MANALIVDLHPELASWLAAIAEKRGLTLQETASRLLDEERMRDLYKKRIVVPADNGQCWVAQTSARALMYSGYETEWTLMPADEAAKHLD